MRTLTAAIFLISAAAAAQETERPILVISAAGAPGMAGGLVGLYRGEGRLRYGLSALVTSGDSTWAGASLDARWSFLSGPISPYLGAGLGVFSARRGSTDYGIQPTGTAEAGIEAGRFFAGVRGLLPLTSRAEGVATHDVAGGGTAALLAQIGLRI